MSQLTKAQITEELTLSKSKIEQSTNTNVKLFRAPFGAYNNTLIESARELGLTSIQWDVDSLDWKGLSAGEITKRVINKARSGSIVLFHNNADNIVDALRLVLDRLTKKGYDIVSIGEILIKDSYYVDSQGQQREK
jgi:peptidoglycan/xylan/chitin deacetylase (PgdA/CDA1 family)